MPLGDRTAGYLYQLGFGTSVNLLPAVVRTFTPIQCQGFFQTVVQEVMDQGVESLNGNTIPVRCLLATVLDVLFERSTFLMLLTCSSVNSIEMVFLLISANYLFVIAQRYEDFRSLQNK